MLLYLTFKQLDLNAHFESFWKSRFLFEIKLQMVLRKINNYDIFNILRVKIVKIKPISILIRGASYCGLLS